MEFLAALPLVLVVAFAGWQLVVAGHTWWKLQETARVAARARYVAAQAGDPAIGLRRAREAASGLLASSPAASRKIAAGSEGEVTVRAKLPLVGPFRLALGESGGPELSAKSRMAP